MIRNLNIGKQLTRLQIRNAQPSKFRKWSNEYNSSARPAIVPCGFISCTQISNERGRRCTQLLGAFNTSANYRCASHWPTRKCRNFNQYPKPQQSQPLSLQLMDRPRLCSTAPQTVGGHFRMPQHVELVKHFLKLIFSQRTVHTAHGIREQGTLSAGRRRLFKWLEIIMSLHPFLAVRRLLPFGSTGPMCKQQIAFVICCINNEIIP